MQGICDLCGLDAELTENVDGKMVCQDCEKARQESEFPVDLDEVEEDERAW